LRWLGHLPVAVLDGGWNQWVAEAAADREIPKPKRARFAAKPGKIWVSARYVRAHLDDARTLLVDARAPDRFRGQNETLDPVAGRIPAARNRFYRDNLDANGRFKASEKLRQEFADVLKGSDPQRVVNYCGSGVSACHNLLAMEYAGLRGARLYPGSWSEWCAVPSRPVETGEPRAD
jgi:thiosulfate/3-mercaptopyruvate sulfurtransferase